MLSRLMTVREQILLAGVGLSILVGSATIYYLRPGSQGEIKVIEEAQAAAPEEKPAASPAAPAPPADPAPAPVSAPPAPAPMPAAPLPVPPPPLAEIAVVLEGAVARPGIYNLPGDARISDLLRQGGGALEQADLRDINLVARLVDGSTLSIPYLPLVEQGGNTLRLKRQRVQNLPQYTRSGSRRGGASHQEASSAPSFTPPAPSFEATPVVSASSGGKQLININTASQDELETLPGIGPALAERIIVYREESPFSTVDGVGEVSGIGEKRLEAIRPFITVQ